MGRDPDRRKVWRAPEPPDKGFPLCHQVFDFLNPE